MKKLLLYFSISAITISSFGQNDQTAPPSKDMSVNAKKEIRQSNTLKSGGLVFWTEDFDWENPADPKGWTLPDGWINEDNTEEELGYLWEWHKDALEEGQYGVVNALNSTTSENGFLSLNLDYYNRDYNFSDMPLVNASITTAPINCSGHPYVFFKMQQMFRYWPTALMTLEVSSDEGVNWVEYDLKMGALISETPGDVSSDTVAHFFANITDAAVGQEAVLLKISWSESPLYYWNIDDLELTEEFIIGSNEILSKNTLNQNYPNPFNGTTKIRYEISASSDIRLEIFDITGKKVREIDEGYKTAGTYIIKLNADNLNAGVYYYILIGDNYSAKKKMIVSK
ncbi:T9SS type A sorting domain-containing protein [Bacteroidota bacterium]